MVKDMIITIFKIIGALLKFAFILATWGVQMLLLMVVIAFKIVFIVTKNA